eukprot:TRINITY_DN11521_c0_g1_i3.p1 TRINITY_DN11521_c0_g1~~TRINITY_DN11521_c0_g1_i3.p1  ORF type:complete len:108 (-),score=18.30 TRINITY_DN11521_c0_g1_i3:281-604(-)
MFIKPGSAQCQNLPSQITQAITSSIDQNQFTIHLFDEAQAHVCKTMKLHSFNRYPYTPFFRDYVTAKIENPTSLPQYERLLEISNESESSGNCDDENEIYSGFDEFL